MRQKNPPTKVLKRSEPPVLADVFLGYLFFSSSCYIIFFFLWVGRRKEPLVLASIFLPRILFYFSLSLFTFLDLFKGRKEPPVLAGILLGQLFDEKSRGGVSWLLLRIHPVLKKFKKNNWKKRNRHRQRKVNTATNNAPFEYTLTNNDKIAYPIITWPWRKVLEEPWLHLKKKICTFQLFFSIQCPVLDAKSKNKTKNVVDL